MKIKSSDLIDAAPVQGEPVYWEWRHLSTHPDTVDFGQWSEWKRVEARSAIHTIDDELAEFRTYIAQGHKYELRALYTTPQPTQAPQAEVTDEQILEIAEPFGEFQYGDAQGDKRIDFARAILALRPERVPMTEVWIDRAVRLADAYANACFDQGLNQRTEDPNPEAKREKLFEHLRHHGITARAEGGA